MNLYLVFILLIALVDQSNQEFFKQKDLIYGFKRILNTSDSQTKFQTKSVDCCFKACHTIASCVTASGQRKANQVVECKFSSIPIHDVVLVDNEEGFLFAKESSFKMCFGDDGIFYEFKQEPLNHDDGKTYCTDTFKDARFFMPKTMNNMLSFVKCFETRYGAGSPAGFYWFLIDLSVTANGVAWGDGINFSDTEISKRVPASDLTRAVGTKFFIKYDIDSMNKKSFLIHRQQWLLTDKSYPICQINPFQLP